MSAKNVEKPKVEIPIVEKKVIGSRPKEKGKSLPKNQSDGDQDTASKDLVQVPIGLVTRAQGKKFKDVLNGLIQELWAQVNL